MALSRCRRRDARPQHHAIGERIAARDTVPEQPNRRICCRLLGTNGQRNESGGRRSALYELPARNHRCLVILMHMRNGCTAAAGAIPQKHMDRDRRAIRVPQIVWDEIPRDVTAHTEAGIARRPSDRGRSQS